MTDFTHIMTLEGQGVLRFSFTCIRSTQKKKVHVSVLTNGPQCYHFGMEEIDSSWKIVNAPKPPDWILKLEPVLQQIIEKNTTQSRAEKILKVA